MKLFKLLLLLTIITNHKSLFSDNLNKYRHFYGINIVLSNNNTENDIINAAQNRLNQGHLGDLKNQISSGNFPGAYGNNGQTYSPGLSQIITSQNAQIVIDNLDKVIPNALDQYQVLPFINMINKLKSLKPDLSDTIDDKAYQYFYKPALLIFKKTNNETGAGYLLNSLTGSIHRKLWFLLYGSKMQYDFSGYRTEYGGR